MVVENCKKTDNFIHKGFERKFHKKKMHPLGSISIRFFIPSPNGNEATQVSRDDTESFNRYVSTDWLLI